MSQAVDNLTAQSATLFVDRGGQRRPATATIGSPARAVAR